MHSVHIFCFKTFKAFCLENKQVCMREVMLICLFINTSIPLNRKISTKQFFWGKTPINLPLVLPVDFMWTVCLPV